MEKGDSDSQAEREKHIGEKEEGQHALSQLPDPDAGLSEEERKKIVCRYVTYLKYTADVRYSGSQTALEA
jgi:hypothetical protein